MQADRFIDRPGVADRFLDHMHMPCAVLDQHIFPYQPRAVVGTHAVDVSLQL